MSVFSFLGYKKLKTRIYIDGYNLYYGALKRSPYKWLDPEKLIANKVIPQSAPEKYSITNIM